MFDPTVPLGRNPHSLSPVIAEEQEKYKAYLADMHALPPANCPENAKLHRQVMLKHASPEKRKAYEKIFRELKLEF